LVIRELSKTAQDVLIVTSSLTQDLVGKGEYFFRTGAVRALGSIIDVNLLLLKNY
jgi:coatomer subunit gamma